VSRRLEHWQYWNRIFSRAYPCGQDCKEEEKVTVGAKQQLVAEIGGKLGVGVNGVSAELSSKLQTSITISEERQTTYTIQKKAPQCLYLRLTSWQQVDEYAIHEDAVLFGRFHLTPKSVTLASRAAVYLDDHFLWAHPDCCNNPRVPTNQQYVLDYPDGRILLPEASTQEPGQEEQDERDTGDVEGRDDEDTGPEASITLFAVDGKWHLRDRVPASALASDIAALVAPQMRAEAPITRRRELDRLTKDPSPTTSTPSGGEFDFVQSYYLHQGLIVSIVLIVGALLVLAGGVDSILALTGLTSWLEALTGLTSRFLNAAPGAVAVVVGVSLILVVWFGTRRTELETHRRRTRR